MRFAVAVAGATCLLVTAAVAQDTETAPVVQPLDPLTLVAQDYPVESLVHGEEGDVRLSLTISPAGRVAKVAVKRTSGWLALDAAAEYYAQARLRFPKDAAGMTTTVDADWTLPFDNEDSYVPDFMVGPPVAAYAPDGRLPVPAGKHTVSQFDYPPSALRESKQGLVQLLLDVDTQGNVTDVRVALSSGYTSLDKAAMKVVRRFKYKPGLVHGQPEAMWAPLLNMSFRLYDGKLLVCHGEPFIVRTERYYRRFRKKPPPVWAGFDQQRHLLAVLVLTKTGWKAWPKWMFPIGGKRVTAVVDKMTKIYRQERDQNRCWVKLNAGDL